MGGFSNLLYQLKRKDGGTLDVLLTRVPELPQQLADQIAGVVRHIRDQPVRKAPSVSESIDWARTLLALGIEEVDEGVTTETLHVLLKYQADIDKVAAALATPS